MKEGQKEIFYICADNFATAKSSPQLELLRKRGIEALLLHERLDDWLMSTLNEFDGKRFRDVARGELELPETEEESKEEAADTVGDDLLKRLKTVLADKVDRGAAFEAPYDVARMSRSGRARHGCADASHHGGGRSTRA